MKCLHCHLETNSKEEQFCCSGCKAAYKLIHDIGLEGFYKNRYLSKNAKDLKPDDIDSFPNFDKYIYQNPGEEKTINLVIEGIHCAACIWLIETALKQHEYVSNARINMSTKRLSISWIGDSVLAEELIKLIYLMGYKAMPFNPEILQKLDKKEEKELLKNIAISGFAAGNVMLISVILWSATIRDMGIATREFLHYISILIAMPAIIYTGNVFIKSAITALRNKAANMDVPISLAIILATGMSFFEVLFNGEYIYFEGVLMLIFFLTIGRFLEKRARGKARSIAHDLLLLTTGFATLIKDGKRQSIAIDDIVSGMELVVAAGEKIPSDSKVIQGASEIDMSIINGETVPSLVKVGDRVFAGTMNLGSSITIKSIAATADNLLNEIIELLEKSEQSKSRYTTLADRLSRLYTPVVHILAVLTFLIWWLVLNSTWQTSLLYAITVLIITCPCALALAVPVVGVLASSRLMKCGILLKSSDALEKLAIIDNVIFDKTGTLTKGKPELVNKSDLKVEDLQLAASMAIHSKHILTKSLLSNYSGNLLDLAVEEFSGRGLEAKYNGQIVKLGRASWCGISSDKEEDDLMEMWLKVEDAPAVQFTFRDTLRSDSVDVISDLSQQGLKAELLSGDKENIVKNIAKQLGIKKFHGELFPIEKQNYIQEQKGRGKHILMVGDGLNDVLALNESLVSISPSSAIDITQNVADIVFQGEKLSPVITSIKIAKFANKLVKQNFTLALIYNMVAVSIAVCGLATPLIAAVAMSSSSLLVIANSLRISKIKI